MRSLYAGFVRWFLVLLTLVALGLSCAAWRSGSLSTLRVVIEEHAEDKIPRLRNDGMLPVLVEKCTYTTDTNKPGETIAYNLEKWDQSKRTWVQALEFAVPELCSPMPTSHGGTKWKRTPLWPGRSLTGWSLPLQHFQKGDWIRVVAVTGVTVRGSSHASDGVEIK